MSGKPALLVHPPLPAFEWQLGAYEVMHLPVGAADAARVTAAVAIGGVGIANADLAKLPALKTVACFGIGVDGFDLAFCRANGIAITHTRDINHEDVADVAIGLIIAVARSFTLGERVLRESAWTPPLAVPPQRRLRGRKLGIVGMGAIGKAIAARAHAFGLEISWHGPRRKDDVHFRYEPDLIALARWADVLAISAKGDKSTEGLIDARVIEALGEDGILVNVSRGNVIDEDALIAALKAGKLAGAGLDVFVDEPTPASRWADVPNTTLTPHLGGGTREALLQSSANVLENLRRHFAAEPLLTPVPD